MFNLKKSFLFFLSLQGILCCTEPEVSLVPEIEIFLPELSLFVEDFAKEYYDKPEKVLIFKDKKALLYNQITVEGHVIQEYFSKNIFEKNGQKFCVIKLDHSFYTENTPDIIKTAALYAFLTPENNPFLNAACFYLGAVTSAFCLGTTTTLYQVIRWLVTKYKNGKSSGNHPENPHGNKAMLSLFATYGLEALIALAAIIHKEVTEYKENNEMLKKDAFIAKKLGKNCVEKLLHILTYQKSQLKTFQYNNRISALRKNPKVSLLRGMKKDINI